MRATCQDKHFTLGTKYIHIEYGQIDVSVSQAVYVLCIFEEHGCVYFPKTIEMPFKKHERTRSLSFHLGLYSVAIEQSLLVQA